MKKELIAHRDPKSPISEIFRTLRTNIQFMNTSKRLKSILITSTSPSEGKSWVASNLAVTFAQAGKRVVLVDADMRKGRQYTIFGVSPKPGLSNYLSGVDAYQSDETPNDITQYIQKTEISNLCLMPAGNIPPNPSELLVSSKMINLLDELNEIAEIIIIDGTPCELVTDSVIISRLVDSTIIVTEYEKTKKDKLQRIITNIKNVNGNIAGVVINKTPMSSKKYEKSYYGSYYGASYKSGNNKVNDKMKKNKKANTKKKKSQKNIEDKVAEIYKNKYDKK